MSTRYNQKNKQRLGKETMKGIKICLKEKKKKRKYEHEKYQIFLKKKIKKTVSS